MNYYNDNDPAACAWLRELIAAGLIPQGVVDGRSIADVQPSDLAGFTQVHLFAGIAGWAHALRLAGWPTDRPVWTGSCPCPPFSCAGKKHSCPECQGGDLVPHPLRTGFFVCCRCQHEWLADGRHLWPEFLRLISECRPATVFGEQVSGSDGLVWLAGVRATLEACAYRVGCLDLSAAGVGAPHIRQRLFWVADGDDGGFKAGAQRHGETESDSADRNSCRSDPCGCRGNGGVAESDGGKPGDRDLQRGREHGQQPEDGRAGEWLGYANVPGRKACGSEPIGAFQGSAQLEDSGSHGGMADTEDSDRRRADEANDGGRRLAEAGGSGGGIGGLGNAGESGLEGHAGNGAGSVRNQRQVQKPDRPVAAAGNALEPWADSRWIYCRDGKHRRVPAQSLLQRVSPGLPDGLDLGGAEGAFPLAKRIPGRVALLRGYGNAINPVVGATFVRAFLDGENLVNLASRQHQKCITNL